MLDGFRISTTAQGGQASLAHKVPTGLIFPAWGTLHSPVTEEGVKVQRINPLLNRILKTGREGIRGCHIHHPLNPSNKTQGHCCYFTVSICKMRQLRIKTMTQNHTVQKSICEFMPVVFQSPCLTPQRVVLGPSHHLGAC